MKTLTEGFQQCYNAQVAVDGEHQMIISAEVSSNPNDQGQLTKPLDALQAVHGKRPATVLAVRNTRSVNGLSRLRSDGSSRR